MEQARNEENNTKKIKTKEQEDENMEDDDVVEIQKQGDKSKGTQPVNDANNPNGTPNPSKEEIEKNLNDEEEEVEEDDEDVFSDRDFQREDTGTLLTFENVPANMTIDAIAIGIIKMGFSLVSIPQMQEGTRTAHVRIVKGDAYEEFLSKYKNDFGNLRPIRMDGNNTVFANIAFYNPTQSFETIRPRLPAIFKAEIEKTIREREKILFKPLPNFFIEIINIKTGILHFDNSTSMFQFLNRVQVTDWFIPQATGGYSLRIIKSLIKYSDNSYMRILAKLTPAPETKFCILNEKNINLIGTKMVKLKNYKEVTLPVCWASIIKKEGNETNMAIGIIKKNKFKEFCNAILNRYTVYPKRTGGNTLTIEESKDKA